MYIFSRMLRAVKSSHSVNRNESMMHLLTHSNLSFQRNLVFIVTTDSVLGCAWIFNLGQT